jgi:hypothetical protein
MVGGLPKGVIRLSVTEATRNGGGAEATTRRVLEGRQVVGRFLAVRPVRYGSKHPRSGEPVDNMFEIAVLERGAEEDKTHRLAFFSTSYDGLSRVRAAIELDDPRPGDTVAVKFTTTAKTNDAGSKAFVNDTAVDFAVYERGPSVGEPVSFEVPAGPPSHSYNGEEPF